MQDIRNFLNDYNLAEEMFMKTSARLTTNNIKVDRNDEILKPLRNAIKEAIDSNEVIIIKNGLPLAPAKVQDEYGWVLQLMMGDKKYMQTKTRRKGKKLPDDEFENHVLCEKTFTNLIEELVTLERLKSDKLVYSMIGCGDLAGLRVHITSADKDKIVYRPTEDEIEAILDMYGDPEATEEQRKQTLDFMFEQSFDIRDNQHSDGIYATRIKHRKDKCKISIFKLVDIDGAEYGDTVESINVEEILKDRLK